jgi:hypothetical protein
MADGTNQDRTALLAEIDREEKEAIERERLEAENKKIELYQLRKTFEQKTGGKMGKAFLIFDTNAGFIVLVKRESVLYKALVNLEEITDVDAERFFKHHVEHPNGDDVDKVLATHEGIVGPCARAAIRAFYLGNVEEVAKK